MCFSVCNDWGMCVLLVSRCTWDLRESFAEVDDDLPVWSLQHRALIVAVGTTTLCNTYHMIGEHIGKLKAQK